MNSSFITSRPGQELLNVIPDLGPNCLQWLSKVIDASLLLVSYLKNLVFK